MLNAIDLPTVCLTTHGIVSALAYAVFIISPSYLLYFQFTDKEAEAQRGEVTWPTCPSRTVAGKGSIEVPNKRRVGIPLPRDVD